MLVPDDVWKLFRSRSECVGEVTVSSGVISFWSCENWSKCAFVKHMEMPVGKSGIMERFSYVSGLPGRY